MAARGPSGVRAESTELSRFRACTPFFRLHSRGRRARETRCRCVFSLAIALEESAAPAATMRAPKFDFRQVTQDSWLPFHSKRKSKLDRSEMPQARLSKC